jgi:hypothetical protein
MSDFYVYALLRETGDPFYIGKGRGYRWTYHEREARKGAKGHKSNIIRDMLGRGVEVIRVKLHEGLTEAVAHAYEVALIKAIGRYPAGPLANGTDGGEGLTGFIPTAEQIEKGAAARRGQKRSAEARTTMSISARSSKARQEANTKTAEKLRGKKLSAETRAKISAAGRGRKQSAEHVAKRIAPHIGAMRSAEARANMAAAQRGHTTSATHREKLAIANRGKKMSAEAIAKTVAAHLGSRRSPETCARISAAKRANNERRRAEATTQAPQQT